MLPSHKHTLLVHSCKKRYNSHWNKKHSSLGDEKMFSNIGVPGLILILIVALVIFGPNKLPEVGRAFGRSIREFKKATEGIADDIKTELKEDIQEAKQDSIDMKK
jgi:sec-independent protein translocase protein TatA